MRFKKVSKFSLRQQKNREFYKILDAVYVPIFVKNIMGIYTACNCAYERFMGLSRNEIIGKTIYDLVDKKLADQYYANDQQLLAHGTFEVYESVVMTEKVNRNVIFRKALCRNSKGEVSGIVGVIIDITEQKKAEETLKRSEEQNRAIIAAVPDAMAIVTADFTIVGFKKAKEFEQISDSDGFIGKSLTEVLLADVATLYMENIKIALQTKQVISFEYQITYNQQIRYREARSHIISDQRVLVMIRDITEKKRMEETIEMRNTEIKNALITLEETQLQLVQQEKLAGIGQLAAGVAHEINNPLGFVLSNFDILKQYLIKITDAFYTYSDFKEKVLASDIQILKELAQEVSVYEKQKKIPYIFEDLDPIIQESGEGLNRLHEIVKALKLFSRVDKQSEFESYDLNAGIKNTLIVAKNEIKYIAVVEIDLKEIPEIKASAGQVNQVLLNMILNSAHAIKEQNMSTMGEIKITSYCDAQFVYCSIQDNGIGMAPDVVNEIFKAFFTTKPIGEGTGLGLSISYDIIVNKHHGDISVHSEKGVGTTFIIKLPVAS